MVAERDSSATRPRRCGERAVGRTLVLIDQEVMDEGTDVVKLVPQESIQQSTVEEMEEVPISQIQGRIADDHGENTGGGSVGTSRATPGADLGENCGADRRCARFADTGTDRWGEQDDLSGASLGLHREADREFSRVGNHGGDSVGASRANLGVLLGYRNGLADTEDALQGCRLVGGWRGRREGREGFGG